MVTERPRKGLAGVSPSMRGWIGSLMGLAATLILLLCNFDGYHFPWLIGPMYPLTIISFVILSLPLAPPSVAQALMANRDAVGSLSWKTLALAFFWVALFFGLGFAYISGLKYLREVDWGCCTAHTTGKVVSLDHTSSKGGPVEWTIYEYEVGGVTLTSAVRNGSRGFSRGQAVDVAYTTFWPRLSNPRGMSDRHVP